MWTELSKWVKDVKTLGSHVNAHQKVTSGEEFNNHIDRMTHFVDSKSPSPVIPFIAQWGHGQSGYDNRESCAQA